MFYFPDKFFKMIPPKDYFWQVFSKVKPIEYEGLITKAKERLVNMKHYTRNSINVTDEALDVLEDFYNDDLDLLSKPNKRKHQIRLKD